MLDESKVNNLLQSAQLALDEQRLLIEQGTISQGRVNHLRFIEVASALVAGLLKGPTQGIVPFDFKVLDVSGTGLKFKKRGLELEYRPPVVLHNRIPENPLKGDPIYSLGQISLTVITRQAEDRRLIFIDFIHPDPENNTLVAYPENESPNAMLEAMAVDKYL
jgi:hypothetical protein